MSNLHEKTDLSKENALDKALEERKDSLKTKMIEGFGKEFEQKSYFDKGFKLFVMSCVGYVLFSAASIYLSIPFLTTYLVNDVSDGWILWVASGILIAVEMLKGSMIAMTANAWLSEGRFSKVTALVGVACLIGSFLMCINGVQESSEQAYSPPKKSEMVTSYDQKIEDLKVANKELFRKHSWKGHMDGTKASGKAHAANSLELSRLGKLAVNERDQLHDAAMLKYNKRHNQTSNVRVWMGGLNELMLLICGVFVFNFKFKSHLEYLKKKEIEKARNAASTPSIPIADNKEIEEPKLEEKLQDVFGSWSANMTETMKRMFADQEAVFEAKISEISTEKEEIPEPKKRNRFGLEYENPPIKSDNPYHFKAEKKAEISAEKAEGKSGNFAEKKVEISENNIVQKSDFQSSGRKFKRKKLGLCDVHLLQQDLGSCLSEMRRNSDVEVKVENLKDAVEIAKELKRRKSNCVMFNSKGDWYSKYKKLHVKLTGKELKTIK